MLGVRYAMLFLLIGLTAVAPAPVHAGPTVISVGAGGDYTRLADALAFAPPGATIELLPGFQQGQWTIDRPLILRGRHGLVLDGGGSGTLLTITAPGVVVTGLTLQNSGQAQHNALIHSIADDVVVAGNRLDGFQRAIAVTDGAARAVIRNNTIVGQGDLPASERGDGIILTDAPGALVELNTVLRVRDAVRLEAAPGGAVRGNLVQDGRGGLIVVGSAGVTAAYNTFDALETAVSGRYANGLILERNTIINSRRAGIILEASADWRVEANLLTHNQRGLAIGAASSGTVRQNRFSANRLAVDVAPEAHAVQLHGNDFIGNRTTVAGDPPAASVWNGNYWGRFARISLDATPARRPVAAAAGVSAVSDEPALPWPIAVIGSAGMIGALLISFTLRRRRTLKPEA